MIKPLTAAVLMSVSICLAAPAQAVEAGSWVCEVAGGRDDHWLGKTHLVIVDADAVRLSNAMIQHFVPEQHVVATIERDNARALAFKWKVDRVKSRSEERVPDMRYRMIIQKKTGAFNISAVPGRYTNTFSGSGRCRPFKK